jgi:hypothetical protein
MPLLVELFQSCWRRSGHQTHRDEPSDDALYGWSATWTQERLLLCVRPDGPHLWLGPSAMAQKVVFFAADLDLASS